MPATQPLVERCGFLRKPQLRNRLPCRRNRHWLLSISHIRLANLMADPLGLHQVAYGTKYQVGKKREGRNPVINVDRQSFFRASRGLSFVGASERSHELLEVRVLTKV